jgi:hypothetical protein
MPPAVLVPIALAGVSLIAQNVQNKQTQAANQAAQNSALAREKSLYTGSNAPPIDNGIAPITNPSAANMLNKGAAAPSMAQKIAAQAVGQHNAAPSQTQVAPGITAGSPIGAAMNGAGQSDSVYRPGQTPPGLQNLQGFLGKLLSGGMTNPGATPPAQ